MQLPKHGGRNVLHGHSNGKIGGPPKDVDQQECDHHAHAVLVFSRRHKTFRWSPHLSLSDASQSATMQFFVVMDSINNLNKRCPISAKQMWVF